MSNDAFLTASVSSTCYDKRVTGRNGLFGVREKSDQVSPAAVGGGHLSSTHPQRRADPKLGTMDSHGGKHLSTLQWLSQGL